MVLFEDKCEKIVNISQASQNGTRADMNLYERLCMIECTFKSLNHGLMNDMNLFLYINLYINLYIPILYKLFSI